MRWLEGIALVAIAAACAYILLPRSGPIHDPQPLLMTFDPDPPFEGDGVVLRYSFTGQQLMTELEITFGLDPAETVTLTVDQPSYTFRILWGTSTINVRDLAGYSHDLDAVVTPR